MWRWVLESEAVVSLESEAEVSCAGPEGVSGVMGNLGPLGRKGEPGGEGGQATPNHKP